MRFTRAPADTAETGSSALIVSLSLARGIRFSRYDASRASGMLIIRYNSAVMAASSKVAPVLLRCTLYCLVSSITVITEQTLVSLNRAMKSLVTGGTTIRTACGMIIRRRASAGDMPSASAASICPRGTACKPAR